MTAGIMAGLSRPSSTTSTYGYASLYSMPLSVSVSYPDVPFVCDVPLRFPFVPISSPRPFMFLFIMPCVIGTFVASVAYFPLSPIMMPYEFLVRGCRVQSPYNLHASYEPMVWKSGTWDIGKRRDVLFSQGRCVVLPTASVAIRLVRVCVRCYPFWRSCLSWRACPHGRCLSPSRL